MTKPTQCICGSTTIRIVGAGNNQRDGLVFLYRCDVCGQRFADYADGVDMVNETEAREITQGVPVARKRGVS